MDNLKAVSLTVIRVSKLIFFYQSIDIDDEEDSDEEMELYLQRLKVRIKAQAQAQTYSRDRSVSHTTSACDITLHPGKHSGIRYAPLQMWNHQCWLPDNAM